MYTHVCESLRVGFCLCVELLPVSLLRGLELAGGWGEGGRWGVRRDAEAPSARGKPLPECSGQCWEENVDFLVQAWPSWQRPQGPCPARQVGECPGGGRPCPGL